MSYSNIFATTTTTRRAPASTEPPIGALIGFIIFFIIMFIVLIRTVKKERNLKKTDPVAYKRQKDIEKIKAKGDLMWFSVTYIATIVLSIIAIFVFGVTGGVIVFALGMSIGRMAKRSYLKKALEKCEKENNKNKKG